MNKKEKESKFVPKVIHYCWFGKSPLPEDAKKCIESWKKFMPEYKIIEWNEENFDINQNKYVKEAYGSKKYAFVSDYARLKIIYDHGGIYFDTDVELIKRIPEKFLKNGYLAREDKKYINTGLGFAAKKNNKTIKRMLDDYMVIPFVKEDGAFDMTPCPVRNTKSIKILKHIDLEILQPEYASPLNWKNGVLKITKNTFSIHHYEASWSDDDSKKRLIKRHDNAKKYGHILGDVFYMMGRILGRY